jgi:exopolysaccharide biosynthesis polyprenyl glycosylphosphotransferase
MVVEIDEVNQTDVFSPFSNLAQNESQDLACARLIPGDAPKLDGKIKGRIALSGKKPMQTASLLAREKLASMPEVHPSTPVQNVLRFLLPTQLTRRGGSVWLRAILADFTLVGLNWLLVGAMLVPLRQIFPRVRLFKYDAGSPGSLLGVALLHAALITLLGCTEGLYAADSRSHARVLGKSTLWATSLLCLAYLMQGMPWPTSALICGAGVLHFAGLLAWRAYVDRPRGGGRNVLIVGGGEVGRRVASYLEVHPEQGRTVCGFLDYDTPLGSYIGGRTSDFARVARRGFIDELILAAPRNRDLAAQILREAQRMRLDVAIVPELFGCKLAEREVEHVGDLPLICLHQEKLPVAGLALKRWMDVAGATTALILLSPLMAVIAGLIKLDSPGPAIYRAPRAGRKGQLFRCYKFRTMVRDADDLKKNLRQTNQRTGPFFKMDRDPRITRLGLLLRRFSLDELPQFWNVLKGEMSLVGPRPHPVDDFAAYDIEHLGRLDVTPGMTGLWQVTARRDPSFQRGIDLDREYIRTWSLNSDLQILLKTLIVVVRGSGQ